MSGAVTIALGQMRVEPAQWEPNLRRAVRLVGQAARAGCAALVLPECLDLGWTDPSARVSAQSIPGSATEMLAAAARQGNLYVTAGLTERDGDRIFNAAVLISPAGRILYRHRKINELDFARELYTTGTSVGVVDTDLGRVGVSICADNFPETTAIGNAMGIMGARWLFSPCAWAVDANHDNTVQPYGELWLHAYRELTTRHPMTVAAASNVGWIRGGPWAGRKCIGCSLAVGPGGRTLAQGPYGDHAESLVVVPLDESGNDSPSPDIQENDEQFRE